jgi:apolipoprotein D and lipocalin family protein
MIMNLINLISVIPMGLVPVFAFAFSSNSGQFAAVKPFTLSKYTGQWFEIARMDFRFERNLTHVTANYSLNKNGTVKVVNRGYDTVKNVWKQAVGKAKFAGSTDEARLKVSFFGPFYAAYNVIALDKDYKYALVAGSSRKYLWILSRETTVPEDIRQKYLRIAADLGFKTSDLVWTLQEPKQE